MEFDAVVKLLTTERANGFFRLLGAPWPRSPLSTDLFKPRVLRLDHLSKGDEAGDILHIEFQSSREEMRWRMLEYYSAIATDRKLNAYPPRQAGRPDAVRQIVILMGHATMMQGHLDRDRLTFDFEVRWLNKVDPERELLGSEDPYDKVLGLLCVEEAHDHEWLGIFRSIEGIQESDPETARDTLALLLAVATLLPKPAWFDNEVEDIGMRIDISDSPLLRNLRNAAVLEGALAVLRQAITDDGHALTHDDETYLTDLSLPDILAIDRRFRAGDHWSDVRGYLPGSSLGDD